MGWDFLFLRNGYNKVMILLDFKKTENLLKRYKIPLIKTNLVNSKKEARDFAEKIGWPVVLKTSSAEVLHRTEKGLVKVGIRSEQELLSAFDEIAKTFSKQDLVSFQKKKTGGILIQKKGEGIETIIGAKRDPVFGTVVMFGLGGIFAEALKDVSFGIAPLSKREAIEMVKSIKSHKILEGYREKIGKAPAGFIRRRIENIARLLIAVSRLSAENQKIKRIDFNPVFIKGENVEVADPKLYVE